MNKCKKLLFAGVATVAGVASSMATDIVSVNATTGAVEWDVSPIQNGLVSAIGIGLAAGVTIFLIYKGWNIMKRFFSTK